MKRKYITRLQLQALLFGIVGAQPVNLTTRTEPKMNKGGRAGVLPNPYYGRISKVTTANVIINFNYANSVNTQRVKEGTEKDFVASERKWGVKIPNTSIVQHTPQGSIAPKLYLEARFLNNTASVYFYDNGIITKDKLKPWLVEASSSAEHQGLSEEKEVIMRDYALDSIIEITLKHTKYIVR